MRLGAIHFGTVMLRQFVATIAVTAALFAMQSRAAAYSMAAAPNLIIDVQSVAAMPGSTGNSLDITLRNTGTASVDLTQVQLGINVATLNIMFTNATTGTVLAPYIFDGQSALGPNIGLGPGSTIFTNDFRSSNTVGTVAPGATFGLAHLLFDVAPGTMPGAYTVSVVSQSTALLGTFGQTVGQLPFTTTTGTITVGGLATTIVPEPLTGVISFGGLLALAAAVTRRR